MAKKASIAVVGAGIAGLACAYELKKAGFNVDLFEKEKQVGGRMASRMVKGKIFDIGADHLGYAYTHMLRYCRELGVKSIPMDAYKFKVFSNNSTETLYGSLSWFTRLKLIIAIKCANTQLDFFNLCTAAHLDTSNARIQNEKKYGIKMASILSEGFVNGYQFHQTKDLSNAVLPSFFSSLKKDDWTLHHLEGGMQALPNALAKIVKAKTNYPIFKVNATKKGVSIKGKSTKQYGAVVIATTSGAAKKLLSNPSPAQKEFLTHMKFSTTISVTFEVPISFLKGEGGVTFVPFNESKIISGYVRQAMKGKDTCKDGKTLLSVWLQEGTAKKVMKKSDVFVFDLIKKELPKVCPQLRGQEYILVNGDLQRWPEAMAKHYPGSIKRVKNFLNNHQGENNIFFAGDYLNSPWTEGALRCGQRVAKKVINKYKN